MDGKTLTTELRQLLQEPSGSSFLDDKTSYDYLYKAVLATLMRTLALTTTQTITTVAGQAAYNLSTDFLKLYMRDSQNRLFIKYNNGSADYFLNFETYEHIYVSNNSASVSLPACFTVKESTLQTRLTGNATATAASVNGETNLSDSGATFLSSVSVGDLVHNTTDGSSGMVIGVSSNTTLVTALFGGTLNQWTTGDAYVITPQARCQLILDPPPSLSSHTMTIAYVYKPTPVYSPYRAYNLPLEYVEPVTAYAAWKYKYRDRDEGRGDKFYQIWDMTTRELTQIANVVRQTKRVVVNFIKTGFRDRTRR